MPPAETTCLVLPAMAASKCVLLESSGTPRWHESTSLTDRTRPTDAAQAQCPTCSPGVGTVNCNGVASESRRRLSCDAVCICLHHRKWQAKRLLCIIQPKDPPSQAAKKYAPRVCIPRKYQTLDANTILEVTKRRTKKL